MPEDFAKIIVACCLVFASSGASTAAPTDPQAMATVTGFTDCGDFNVPGFAGDAVQRFTFALPETSVVRLQPFLTNGACHSDLQISVLDAAGNLVAYSDGSEFMCDRILAELPAGEYRVRILSFFRNDIDPYVMQFYTGACSTCGNDLIEAEDCDDGNLNAADGCDGTCRRDVHAIAGCGSYRSSGYSREPDLFRFTLPSADTIRLQTADAEGKCPGDGSLSVYSESGDRVVYDGDGVEGCSRIVYSLQPGTYTVEVHSTDTFYVRPYRLEFYTGSCSICGNGSLEVEACDGLDLGLCRAGPCTSSCTCPFLPLCGDSIVDFSLGEDCDDGNLQSGDGCDEHCRRETTEILSCGSYQPPGLLLERITKLSLNLAAPQEVRLRMRDSDGCDGFPAVEVQAEGVGTIAFGQDPTADACAEVLATLPAGSYTIFLYTTGATTSSYVLDYFNSECSDCGNGTREAEQCDDGNEMPGDGCDAQCDHEPPPIDGPDLPGCGSFDLPEIEHDSAAVFSFSLDAESIVRIELSDGAGGCAGFSSQVDLYTDNGLRIAGDDNSGFGLCSRLLLALPTGTYRIRIQAVALFGAFVLDFHTSACSVCGNGLVEAEECDDGNLLIGDGCDDGCRLEQRMLEACGFYPSAAIGVGDEQEWSLVLDEDTLVQLETGDGSDGCPGDTYLTVRRDDGQYVAADDYGGVGDCSRVELVLSAGIYVVRVNSWSFAGVGPYVLQFVTDRCSTCGNGEAEVGEECDDANSISGDGCDTDCQARVPIAACGDYSAPGFSDDDENDFRLNLEERHLVHLETASTAGCPGDTVLEVRSSAGDLVASDDQSGLGPCSALTTHLDAGEYLVIVRGFEGVAIGPYRLQYATDACSICGNSVVELGEDCDRGQESDKWGDFCRAGCVRSPCGQPVNFKISRPTTTDAKFTLRAAVGINECDARVCDVNGDGRTTGLDALTVLRAAVGTSVALACPAGVESFVAR